MLNAYTVLRSRSLIAFAQIRNGVVIITRDVSSRKAQATHALRSGHVS